MNLDHLRVDKIEQLNLEVAGGCNLRCTMCPHSMGEGREKEFQRSISRELFYKIVDEALELGLTFVNFGGGGEPLLYRYLDEGVSYLKSHNIRSLIYTNGQLLTPERFERLCKAGMSVVKVSCHGYDRASYHKWMSADTYDYVRANLKECFQILKDNNYETE